MLAAANTAMLRTVLFLTRHPAVDGFTIVDFAADGAFAQVLPLVTEAIRLIAIHDPRRYTRIHRDIQYIIVARTPLSEVAEYWPNLRACILDPSFARSHSAGRTALNIVHEATHARLWKVGVRYKENVRARVERRCILEEIAFASQVPDGGELEADARSRLHEPAFWNDEAVQSRQQKRLVAIGMPEWVRRIARP
jgi:hypothetical protein